jgi:hypothetical protein
MRDEVKEAYQKQYMMYGAITGMVIGILGAIITGLGTDIINSIVAGGMFGATGAMMLWFRIC